MNKHIEEKAKDDRMSNHATFIAAKRQEIASLTAQIETKLTWQGEPAVEAESMKNEFKGCRTVACRSEGCLGQRERSGSPGTPSQSRNNVLKWRVSGHRRWKSICQTLDCGSRQAFCGGQHSNSSMQIGDEMVCFLNAEFDGDDSKKPCCIKSFDKISAENMIGSD